MSTITATPKQVSYALSLAAQRGLNADEHALANLDRAAISRYISTLLAQRPAPARELADGIYTYQGDIVKVQHAVHGSGRQYAKRLIAGTTSWEYAPGLIRSLTAADALTLDRAREYGALYGVCAVCGRTLTDEDSIAAGIGPVCAARL